MEDMNKVINKISCQIKDVDTLRRWVENGIISAKTNFANNKNNISGTGGYLHTLIEQETAILFSRLPEYEIEDEDTNLKELIAENLLANEKMITNELRKAIKNYVIYGATAIKFLIVNNTLVAKAINPYNLEFDLIDNSYVASKGNLEFGSKIAQKLKNKTSDVIEVDFNTGVRAYFAYNNQYIKKLIYPNTFVALFNSNEREIQSGLLKVKEYLLNHEALTSRMLDLQEGATLAKGILDERFAPIYKELKENQSVELIEGSIPAEGANPFYWIDNSPITNTLGIVIQQIDLLQEKIQQTLGLPQIFQTNNEVNQNETRINAMDRAEKSNIVIRAKQEKVNDFIKDFYNKYVANLLAINGMQKDISLHIETNAIGLLENQQIEQQKEQTIQNIFGMLNQAQTLIQGGNVAYIQFMKQVASSELQNSNIKNKMIEEAELAFDEAIQNAGIVKQQQQQALQMQMQGGPPPNPEQQMQQQQQAQKIQMNNLNIEKTALDNAKKQNELQQTPQDEELKNMKIQEAEAQTATHRAWTSKTLVNFFAKIRNLLAGKSNQQQLPPTEEGV
ncbi:hypothetical protein ACFX5K_01320 [Rickettsiales bacterium LUAb2]